MLATIHPKHQALADLEQLPEPEVWEVITFIEFLKYRVNRESVSSTPFIPVVLGGLWEGVTISDDDIEEVRRDMWRDFMENTM